MVSFQLLVLTQQALQAFAPEVPAADASPVEKEVAGHLPEVAAEPLRHGHAEAHLAPPRRLGGELGGEGPLEQVLALPAPELQVRRAGGGKLELFLSSTDIKGGEIWRNSILEW